MKRLLLAFLLLILGLVSIVTASTDSACFLNVTLLNQDPYPAVPGEYVDVVFQLSGIQNPSCDGATFLLNPSYPFSIDGENSIKNVKDGAYLSNYKTDWLIPYTLRVDKEAYDGAASLEVKYEKGTVSNPAVSKSFDIEIEDSRTTFDAVIQETTSTEMTIAIANTGKNTANSAVVRIPEQTDFRVTGSDGQMVGNLESGDYTITSFSVSAMPNNNKESQTLLFDIYYTDNIGERRIVNMELPLNAATAFAASNGTAAFSQRRPGAQQSSNAVYYYIIIAIVIVGIIYFIYKKKKGSKIHKTSNEDSSGKTQNWLEKAKEKHRK